MSKKQDWANYLMHKSNPEPDDFQQECTKHQVTKPTITNLLQARSTDERNECGNNYDFLQNRQLSQLVCMLLQNTKFLNVSALSNCSEI
jgi:hypothetical protein